MDWPLRFLSLRSLGRYPMHHIHSLRLFVRPCRSLLLRHRAGCSGSIPIDLGFSLLGGHRLCCKRIDGGLFRSRLFRIAG